MLPDLYATVDDMVQRFGADEICMSDPSLDMPRGAIDEARINQALADASDLINSYVQRRYEIPLAPVLPVVTRMCCLLARHDLALGAERAPSEQIKEGRQTAMAWLAAVAAGKATLDATVKNEDSGVWSRFQSRTPTVFRGRMW
ncbi:DUF1320 domain-containing protein [Formicincola oecophyllae]|uniref:DUF1320 domain-containing protein n=1 Tax=Formicincola oecophyllae TaxID=2558361 RepID=A0A4Y6U9D3_9PROT|nr:DUF1320 domain-containing protein [Formicincola oecophyllae]QDH13814.1 DUF1320 domain-containing protein [Formicincola oecophyllae]